MRCSAYEGLSRVVGRAPAFCGSSGRSVEGASAPSMFPPNRDYSWVRRGCGEGVEVLEHGVGWKVVVGAMDRADGLGSGCGVRRLPSSYASSRVTRRRTDRIGRCGGAGICAQSGDPRSSALDGPKRKAAPTTLNCRRTRASASCRASIRCGTVGQVRGIACEVMRGVS